MKQITKMVAIVSTVCGLAAGMHGVAAHHSATMFDFSKNLTIKGKVIELRWVNPHASLEINGVIKEGEAPETWLLEMTSPGNLTRVGGWTRTAIKPGDIVTVEFNPLRDAGKRGGNLQTLTLASTGQVFTSNLLAQERPGLQ
jgi:hypothetical protein